ncbi:MAG: hypothetical protein RR491_00010 [Lachnospiraceae bacterium]
MGTVLKDLVNDNRSLSLAGMCKNAGKTTVLNRIIRELDKTKCRMGLTSIGRDGEASDIVTGTLKPGIFVREGTILATAAGLLPFCDTTKEILDTSGIHTPMGEVVVVRALSDGNVQLAGPSTNTQLIQVSGIFNRYGVDKIIIDGAISRKSLCSTKVAQSVILCSGASYDKNIDRVVADTEFFSELLSLKAFKYGGLIGDNEVEGRQENFHNRYRLMDPQGNGIPCTAAGLLENLSDKTHENWKYCYLKGAVTDLVIKPLLMSNLKLEDKVFIAGDSSKILLCNDVYSKMKIKGASMEVLSKTDLLAVTINPFSAYGNHFDKDLFMEKISEKITCPIFNVMEDE